MKILIPVGLMLLLSMVSSSAASQCSRASHQILDDSWRKIDYDNRRKQDPTNCDNKLKKGWYRLQGAAGTRLPTFPAPNGVGPTVSKMVCGTHGTAWMVGDHPTPGQGIVKRDVCFEWEDRTCYGKTSISVVACNEDGGIYYVYELTPPSGCSLGYCGVDSGRINHIPEGVNPIVGCDCTYDTETNHLGKEIGACLTTSRSKHWCYIENGYASKCPDKRPSKRGNRWWSWKACGWYTDDEPHTGK